MESTNTPTAGLESVIVSIRETKDQIWQVGFLEYDLGHFDNERSRMDPASSWGQSLPVGNVEYSIQVYAN